MNALENVYVRRGSLKRRATSYLGPGVWGESSGLVRT